jgi:hypothetical protein
VMDSGCVIIAAMKRSVLAHALAFFCLALVLLAGLAAPARAQQPGPADVVRAHFAAITAEDYTGADAYFSAAFLRAFKADVQKLNYYYIARQAQIAAKYEVTEVVKLNDPGRETMLAVVEFGPFNPDAFVTATERMHYYLIREKVEAGAPLRDAQGMAWRIDIVDALRFDSLADARRRPYLYTHDSWDDDASRELRSRQGLYRIYLALEAFREANGQYPFRLLGGENRRDELIAGKYLADRYPACGFAGRSMDEYGADRNHAGDFGYYAVDNDGDGKREAFWLILHGKEQSGFYYTDRDIVYIINQEYAPDQRTLAEQFADFWRGYRGQTLALRDITWERGLDEQPAGVAAAAADALQRLSDSQLPGQQLAPTFPGVITPREASAISAPAATAEPLVDDAAVGTTASPEPDANAGTTAPPLIVQDATSFAWTVQLAAQLSALAAKLRPAGSEPLPEPTPAEELEVHSYGM